MGSLIKQINSLKKSEVKFKVDQRLNEFEKNEPFSELCFCILTANSTAERCIAVQSKVGKGFHTLSPSKLQKKLKENGCRFHNKRSSYIIEARKKKQELTNSLKELNEKDLREWLAKNIKGLGYKESSHFLRNIGYKDSAIIDFHILDILEKNNLIKKPKTLNKNNYLAIELKLKVLAKKLKLNLAELDLYLWYLETGKILK
ncbi:N-glycosylase/DNA lyase [archaeon]|jgi:N-glycosylase/DNA lyase|nr:N-glycosylase/DNA lyase [archaeon]MBT4440559.1 N-glycosylase/DNA lyase [archaeon]